MESEQNIKNTETGNTEHVQEDIINNIETLAENSVDECLNTSSELTNLESNKEEEAEGETFAFQAEILRERLNSASFLWFCLSCGPLVRKKCFRICKFFCKRNSVRKKKLYHFRRKVNFAFQAQIPPE